MKYSILSTDTQKIVECLQEHGVAISMQDSHIMVDNLSDELKGKISDLGGTIREKQE